MELGRSKRRINRTSRAISTSSLRARQPQEGSVLRSNEQVEAGSPIRPGRMNGRSLTDDRHSSKSPRNDRLSSSLVDCVPDFPPSRLFLLANGTTIFLFPPAEHLIPFRSLKRRLSPCFVHRGSVGVRRASRPFCDRTRSHVQTYRQRKGEGVKGVKYRRLSRWESATLFDVRPAVMRRGTTLARGRSSVNRPSFPPRASLSLTRGPLGLP
ncbi:hypothetical protein MTO96_014566 [Rhipicephalus appendiculatus]